MPYDEFIIEQIAGDLLPEATQDQIVATGFLRNSMINEEGGIDPEQFRMEAMFDRMDAIGKGMLGLTIQCAQCHTHKYDPIDAHRVLPDVRVPQQLPRRRKSPSTRRSSKRNGRRRAAIIRRIEDGIRAANPDWRERMAAWEEAVRGNQPEWTIVRPQTDAIGGQKHYATGRWLDTRRRLRADNASRPNSRSTRNCRRSPPCGWNC